MFGKPTRTILCPSCGRLTRADAEECLVCGRRRPGMWGLSDLFRRLFRTGSPTQLITVACVGLYVLSLVIDPAGAMRPRGPFEIFSPSNRALQMLGATGAFPWAGGEWWTLFTAIYLHGGVLHILFNALWIRQLGPAVEELYGPARFFVIFTVAGVAGFVVSNFLGVPFTVGASGSIFGLLGAMVAFGRRRGGAFGAMVLRQYGQWALLLFILGFFMSGVNNLAHAGGFLGGLAAGLVLSLAERRAETSADHLLAAGLIVMTIVAFGLALSRSFLG
jgi:membrane associated rhomboid family serine protease